MQREIVQAGGVALNCVGNGVILREGPFDKIWIQPAAGDARLGNRPLRFPKLLAALENAPVGPRHVSALVQRTGGAVTRQHATGSHLSHCRNDLNWRKKRRLFRI